jgi:hypothetical protein
LSQRSCHGSCGLSKAGPGKVEPGAARLNHIRELANKGFPVNRVIQDKRAFSSIDVSPGKIPRGSWGVPYIGGASPSLRFVGKTVEAAISWWILTQARLKKRLLCLLRTDPEIRVHLGYNLWICHFVLSLYGHNSWPKLRLRQPLM